MDIFLDFLVSLPGKNFWHYKIMLGRRKGETSLLKNYKELINS
jgi:hypothetical protein